MTSTRLLRVNTATRLPFHVAVKEAVDAVTAAGGWIVSHQFFSNSLAMLACQLPAAAVPSLARALHAGGLHLQDQPPSSLDTTGECLLQLTITMLHDDPDQRREIPPFG